MLSVIGDSGRLAMTGTTVHNNIGKQGGGVNLDLSGSAGLSTIDHTTISSNFNGPIDIGGSNVGDAGGLRVLTTVPVTVSDSTITANRTFRNGGGVWFTGSGDGSLALIDSTLTDNQASFAGSTGNGGGVWNGGGTLTGTRTIIAKNTDPGGASEPDLHGDISPSFVLLGSATGSTGIATGPLVGSNGVPKDPKLGPLADNDGTTKTHAIGTDSPAFDAGGTGCAGGTDQRDFPRPQLDACDIGAYEHVDSVPPETSFGAQPANPSLTAEAAFTLTSTDTDGTGIAYHRCSLDGAEYATCPDPLTLTVTEGTHTLEVFAVDDGGNVDASAASFTWLTDLNVPSVTIDGPPAVSRSGTAEISFTASDGNGAGVQEVICAIDDEQFDVCTSPLTFTDLAEGSHLFRAQAIDNVNRFTNPPAELTWTYDVPPTAADDGGTTSEDTPLEVTGRGLLANDSADATGTQIGDGPAHGTVALAADGGYTYTPAADYNGPDSFTYEVTDGGPGSFGPATVALTVTPINDPPSFTSGGDVSGVAGTPFDAPWATAISPGPADEAGQTVTFSVAPAPAAGLFTAPPVISPAGRLAFTGALGGAYTGTVTATDGLGATTSRPLKVTLAATATPTASPTPSTPAVLSKLRGSRKRVSFTLSAAARVTVAVRRGKKRVRRVTVTGKAGANRVKLKKLKPGRYRVTATPAGGKAVAKRFRVKR